MCLSLALDSKVVCLSLFFANGGVSQPLASNFSALSPPLGSRKALSHTRTHSHTLSHTLTYCLTLSHTLSHFSTLHQCLRRACRTRKLDMRLSGKGNSSSHGARPVQPIISIITWIRTSGFLIKIYLSLQDAQSPRSDGARRRVDAWQALPPPPSPPFPLSSSPIGPLSSYFVGPLSPSLIGPLSPSRSLLSLPRLFTLALSLSPTLCFLRKVPQPLSSSSRLYYS